jgi:hypothetical protein
VPGAGGRERQQGIRLSAWTAQWVAGCVAVGSVALIGAGLVLAYVDRLLLPASLTNWTFSSVSGQVVNVAVPVTGFVLASRRPENRIGWIFLVAGLGLGLVGFSNPYALHALVVDHGTLPAGRAFGWLSNWIWMVPTAMLAFLFLLFPTGRLHSRRWRPAAWLAGGALVLAAVCMLTAATRLWAHPFAASGQTGPGGLTGLLYAIGLILISAALLVSVVALVVRFARSAGEERLQLKWCAWAALVLAVVFVASNWVNSAAVYVLQNLAFLGLWTAIAFAVLKYRLYDIDRIISRTLAYAIVTGLLVGVYGGLVLLATRVLPLSSPVAVAGATLAAAALFSPLRRRVQQVVDRRFNRARYDADRTIAAFAARLNDAVDLDTIRGDLVAVAQQALEPAHASVWISRHE